MQITVLQAFFIGIWAAIAMIGTLLGNYTAVPLIYATGVGVILNDIPTAVIVGAAGQTVWLGFGISQGGVRPPDPIAPGIFATVLAITERRTNNTSGLISITDAGVYIGLSIAIGISMQLIITSLFTVMSPLSNLAKNALMRERYKLFSFYANASIIILALLTFIFGLVVGLSANGISHVAQNIPGWLRNGLRVAGGLLPALGFALILKVMMKREYIGFGLLGYFLAVVFDTVAKTMGYNFSVLALTIAALAIVLIIVFVKKLAGISDSKSIAFQPKQGDVSNEGI